MTRNSVSHLKKTFFALTFLVSFTSLILSSKNYPLTGLNEKVSAPAIIFGTNSQWNDEMMDANNTDNGPSKSSQISPVQLLSATQCQKILHCTN